MEKAFDIITMAMSYVVLSIAWILGAPIYITQKGVEVGRVRWMYYYPTPPYTRKDLSCKTILFTLSIPALAIAEIILVAFWILY